jgi:hypothetical protein
MTEEEALQLRKENQELREDLKQTQELLRVALAYLFVVDNSTFSVLRFLHLNSLRKP